MCCPEYIFFKFLVKVLKPLFLKTLFSTKDILKSHQFWTKQVQSCSPNNQKHLRHYGVHEGKVDECTKFHFGSNLHLKIRLSYIILSLSPTKTAPRITGMTVYFMTLSVTIDCSVWHIQCDKSWALHFFVVFSHHMT